MLLDFFSTLKYWQSIQLVPVSFPKPHLSTKFRANNRPVLKYISLSDFLHTVLHNRHEKAERNIVFFASELMAMFGELSVESYLRNLPNT